MVRRERRLVCIFFAGKMLLLTEAGSVRKNQCIHQCAHWFMHSPPGCADMIQVSLIPKRTTCSGGSFLVRERRLELPRRLTHAPQTCLSTCSSTLAYSVRELGSIESLLTPGAVLALEDSGDYSRLRGNVKHLFEFFYFLFFPMLSAGEKLS